MSTQAELLSALKDTIRMLEAVRYSAGLGWKQAARLEAAKNVAARAEANADPIVDELVAALEGLLSLHTGPYFNADEEAKVEAGHAALARAEAAS